MSLREPSPGLQGGSRRSGLTTAELWVRCFALGGMRTPAELDAFVHGQLTPSAHDWELIAVALNEHLREAGIEFRVPYRPDDRE